MLEKGLSNKFLEHFIVLKDPRRYYGNKRHELSDILVITILAVLSVTFLKNWERSSSFIPR